MKNELLRSRDVLAADRYIGYILAEYEDFAISISHHLYISFVKNEKV